MGAQPDTLTSTREVWHGVPQILAQVSVAAHLATYLEFKGQTMVVSVFEALASDPKSLLPRDAYRAFCEGAEPHRVRCYYVAGMPAGFILRTFERLFSPRMGSVFDKL